MVNAKRTVCWINEQNKQQVVIKILICEVHIVNRTTWNPNIPIEDGFLYRR
jgi:hypothetical protein